MILGGAKYIIPVIKTAKKMGVYVITCDYLPDNIAHKYSDEYCNVSIVDRKLVLKCAKEHRIDGIMSFACDPGVTTAAYVAQEMRLPSCGPLESVEILQNKGKFREYLKENGFHVPWAITYSSMEEAAYDSANLPYPLIVKPTDSAGSKGVHRVDTPASLRVAIEDAMRYSVEKKVLLESYLEKKGDSSDSDCFSIDGKLVYSSFSSQKFDMNAENPYTPAAFTWPSTFSKESQDHISDEVQRLITLLGMKTSLYNIESRECTDGKTYIMEVSPRGGGNRLAEMLDLITGSSLIENSIRAALDMQLKRMEKPEYEPNWAEIILHSKESGRFNSINFSQLISKYIYELDIWVKRGEYVSAFSGANHSIGTLIIKTEKHSELQQILNNIDQHIRVNMDKG